jgi:hypothetical protein
MRRFLLGIFDQHGRALPDADPTSLWIVRQVCEYFYKLALPFSNETLDKSEESFVEIDEDLGAQPVPYAFLEEVRKNVETHYLFPKVEDILASNRPRFGPGTFASSIRVSAPEYKRRHGTTTTLPADFRGVEGFFKSYPSSGELFRFGEDTAKSSELLFVPKDSRGPRVIIREPLHALRMQMAFFDWFSRYLEVNTFRRVNFRDQQANRELARAGSIGGKWATIDLKDASDRVSLKVIRHVVRNVPALRYFLKFRTDTVLLPSGNTIKLNKLAGMGSGLTFVMMAFLIHVVIATALTYRYGSYTEAAKNVYVYGDDIIVRNLDAKVAMAALAKVGLKVNTSKSYTNTTAPFFRESCGGDYLDGQDVAPVRMRLPGADLSAAGHTVNLSGDGSVLAIERHARELVQAGFCKSAEFLYELIETCTGKLPVVSVKAHALGRVTMLPSSVYSTDASGNYPKLSVLVPKPVRREHASPNAYFFLSKYLNRGEVALLEWMHPEACSTGFTYDEPRKVVLRRRKVSAFALIPQA